MGLLPPIILPPPIILIGSNGDYSTNSKANDSFSSGWTRSAARFACPSACMQSL